MFPNKLGFVDCDQIFVFFYLFQGGDNELSDLLKQNALLEGKVEMLSMEAETAIKERAQCQTELGALKSQLKVWVVI